MWDLEILGFSVYFLFYNFFLYCFFGWIYESLFVSFRKRIWVNRGFLNGPVIPIYGAGATIVYVLISPVKDDAVLVFISGLLIATALEYITSYTMEKLFHAKWWDYSEHKYNLQGRICLLSSLFWGFLSIFMVEVLQPIIDLLIARIPRRAGEIAGVVIFVLFLSDLVVTVIYTLQLDKKLSELAKIRDELADYLVSLKNETRDELLSRLEEASISNLADYIRELFANRLETEELAENKEVSEQKAKGFIARYKKGAELKNIIHKRIVKAFPTMKSTRSERILEDLRKKRK